jgi:hypothetical protein
VTPVISRAYEAFRPRRGRLVALGVGVASVLLFGGLAAVLPGSGLRGWGVADSVLMLGFGLLVAALMWRFATVRAVPNEEGLLVRNLLLTRRLAWLQIERVRFHDGDPWAVLELVDGEQVPVMAVQRADGDGGRREIARLLALVQARGAGSVPGA